MSRARQQLSVSLCAVAMFSLSAPAVGQITNWVYDFKGYSAPSADMETLFGPKVAELDAKAYGFSFGGTQDPFRNLNIISQVFKADEEVTIGIGENGTNIVIPKGGYTYAYTLDYSTLSGIATNSPVNDFQLYRVVHMNPGLFVALDQVIGGAYNTAPEFNGPAFEAYPEGFTGEEYDFGSAFSTSEAEFSWPNDDQVDPGTKAMVLMFCTPVVQPMQIGWDSVEGYSGTGEGGDIIGGSATLGEIPVLVPVVPEPGTVLLLTIGTTCLLRRRNLCRY